MGWRHRPAVTAEDQPGEQRWRPVAAAIGPHPRASNWAKLSKMFSVSRPMLVVVLKDCVTLMKVT
jgi:hypothetical protein